MAFLSLQTIVHLLEQKKEVDLNDQPAIKNDLVRSKIADWYIQAEGLKYTKTRTLTALSKGETPCARKFNW